MLLPYRYSLGCDVGGNTLLPYIGTVWVVTGGGNVILPYIGTAWVVMGEVTLSYLVQVQSWL